MAKTASSKIHVELSADELQALIKLADDQLFRVKFIDPKMPGYKNDLEQLHAAESALSTLKHCLPLTKALQSKNPSNIHITPKRS